MLKTIVIVGTKGVGKSTLFNKLTKKYSLTKGQKTTPQVNYVEKTIKIRNQTYQLVDTPPFNLTPKNIIEKAVREQIEELLTKSDLICWVVKKIDEETLRFNQILRKYSASRILVLNQAELEVKEASFLTKPHFFLISDLSENSLEQLSQKLVQLFPSSEPAEPVSENQLLKLLVFGPPNSGKSTLMNYLLQKNRSLVTPIAGTTQEPVVSQWIWKKTINFQLVDTAGITKQEKIAKSWWRKCEMAWAIIDATTPLTKQILQIVNLGEKFSKPLIIVVNKLDLVKNNSERAKIETELRKRLKSLSYVPVLFLSALTGNNTRFLLETSAKMLQKFHQKFSKKELETQIQKIVTANPPPSFSGHRLKIYFAKHEAGSAHYFIFFVNNPRWVHFAYQRYLVNQLRKNLSLEHLPIRIVFRKSV